MTINYQPKGVCAQSFRIEVENGTIEDINVIGGCAGNLLGLKSLLKGMSVTEAVEKLEGIPCGGKPTSCPDQIAQALKNM